ncbi:MAG: flippase [Kiritimatiellae bacterium]|nr:flippase [Kiritimatiellia bacterium]
MLGKATSMVGVLFVGILVGRYLGPEQYGLMNYVISFVALFEILSEFGLGNIEIRELAKAPEHRDEIMGTCFVLRMTFAVLAYLLLLSVVFYTEDDLYTRKVIAAYGLCLFAFPFNVARNYFTSIVQNEYVVKSQIARTILGAGIKVFLLWKKMSLTWFILAAGFDFYLLAIGYAQAYRSQVGRLRDWHFDIHRIPFLLAESFPLLLSGAAVVVYQRIDQVMIRHLIGKEGVGYFATAALFVNVALVIPTVLVQTVTPFLIRMHAKNLESYEKMAERMMGGVVWLTVAVCSGVTWLAPWLICWTYGQQYTAAIPVLQVLIWKTTASALSVASGYIIIVEGIQKLTAIRDILGCVACVALNRFLLPRWGVMGAAWATLATIGLSGFVANALVPTYRHVFRLQVRALLGGWKELFRLKNLNKSNGKTANA